MLPPPSPPPSPSLQPPLNRAPPPRPLRPLPSSAPEDESGDSSDSPPEKKQKVNEGDGYEDSSDDSSSEDSSDYSSDKETLPPLSPPSIANGCIPNSKTVFTYPQLDKPRWKRYLQQVRDSEGFDVDDFPGRLGTVYPMPNYLQDPKNVKMLEDYAGKALERYNKQRGTDHKVDKILKVNTGGCRNCAFFITFTVKTSDGKEDYFQAKVVRSIENTLDFPIIRERAKKGVDIW